MKGLVQLRGMGVSSRFGLTEGLERYLPQRWIWGLVVDLGLAAGQGEFFFEHLQMAEEVRVCE